MSKIAQKIPYLKNYLTQVQDKLEQELTTKEHKFNDTVLQYFNENAKLIRPALTLIAASYKNDVREKEITCAAAMEMLHVASLIHDDIIDNSDFRRGVETINKTHGVGFAVICGDFLFSKSFEMLFKTENYNALKYVGSNTVDMCFGEVEQFVNKFNQGISYDSYIGIIDKKTGSLFQSNLIAGATLTKMKKSDSDKLLEFGKYFGRVFQITDDIKDYQLGEKELGKPVLHDISNGVYSLPIIIALDKGYIAKEDIGNDFSDTINVLKRTSAIDEAIDKRLDFYNMAKNSIHDFDKSVKEMLLNVLDLVYFSIKSNV